MTETIQNTTKTFKFSFPTCTNEEILFKLEVPVEIPHNGSTRELVQRVINMFHIPVYLEDELNEKLAEFVANETKKFHNERDEILINQLKNSELNVDGIVKNWEKLFKENVFEFAEQKGTPDEEVFAAAYHKLVHSPALETILQVEDSYARTVMETLKNRDEDIKKLMQRQTEEMEEKVRLLNTSTTEEEINETAARHFEEQSETAGRWGSQLDALYQTQRAQHRAWLLDTLERHQAADTLHTPTNSPLGTFAPERAPAPAPPAPPAPRPHPRLEESFTIHLGSQLKQTHNVRLAALDLRDLCRADLALAPADRGAELGRRLQTSLGLYSGELCACVALADGPGGPGAGAPAAAARLATDHHFPDVDAQLARAAAALRPQVQQQERGARRGPRPGDVLVTRHSNLAELHVVFHLVVDDSSLKGEITSRHPAILGLRNIVKAACLNDVSTLSLPLLLRHECSEEMTTAWCVRRAELVLKCVKGFMLETAGWGGGELRTLQALAPAGLAPAAFGALAALPPAVFRLSTPLRAPRAVRAPRADRPARERR